MLKSTRHTGGFDSGKIMAGHEAEIASNPKRSEIAESTARGDQSQSTGVILNMTEIKATGLVVNQPMQRRQSFKFNLSQHRRGFPFHKVLVQRQNQFAYQGHEARINAAHMPHT